MKKLNNIEPEGSVLRKKQCCLLDMQPSGCQGF